MVINAFLERSLERTLVINAFLERSLERKSSQVKYKFEMEVQISHFGRKKLNCQILHPIIINAFGITVNPLDKANPEDTAYRQTLGLGNPSDEGPLGVASPWMGQTFSIEFFFILSEFQLCSTRVYHQNFNSVPHELISEFQ